ncbi:hypothetical protein [Burkholderia ubonensis]|uniref:hypothetical protein n=1 Tax=Burkholderia ubonensis TaxID=101571 RepID=UPI001E3701C3|nr:hypothetical protein [Burkholderia ubonensis]
MEAAAGGDGDADRDVFWEGPSSLSDSSLSNSILFLLVDNKNPKSTAPFSGVASGADGHDGDTLVADAADSVDDEGILGDNGRDDGDATPSTAVGDAIG